MSRIQFCHGGAHGLVRGMTKEEMNTLGHENATWVEALGSVESPRNPHACGIMRPSLDAGRDVIVGDQGQLPRVVSKLNLGKI